jgi:hypothetical protein
MLSIFRAHLWPLMRCKGFVSFVLLCTSTLSGRAQTVRPVIAEFQEKARARFELVNDSLIPLNVVLEPKSFTLNEDGLPSFRPLDKQIHLKLSTMSFRIPPRQTHYVFYEATADRYPAWFVIYATFAGLPQQSGLNVQLELPHTVYLLQKQPLEERDVQIQSAEYMPASRQVTVELENSGDRFGRIEQVEISGDHDKVSVPGFPLMPHTRRKVQAEWKGAQPPQRIQVRFKHFRLMRELQQRRN